MRQFNGIFLDNLIGKTLNIYFAKKLLFINYLAEMIIFFQIKYRQNCIVETIVIYEIILYMIVL